MMPNSRMFAALAATLTISMRLNPRLVSTALLSLSKTEVAEQDLLSTFAELNPNIEPIKESDFSDNRRLMDRTVNFGITPIPITDPAYPFALAEIDDPPPVLYLRGDLTALDEIPGLAIVGTRKATKNGLIIAERIAEYFAERDWTIVSGLALGIDAAAHKGALKAGGKTIAVFAHGLDEIYPKTNKNLADEILQMGGAFVSEYPIGFPARPEQFILRNRIQIGLSVGSVIVEGEEKSGTKTQAEYCLRNRRELFAVIPTETTASLNLAAALPRILVEGRGATPIRSRDDYEKVEARINAKKNQLNQKKNLAATL